MLRVFSICGATFASAMVARISLHEFQNLLDDPPDRLSNFTKYTANAYMPMSHNFSKKFEVKDAIPLNHNMKDGMNGIKYAGFNPSLARLPKNMVDTVKDIMWNLDTRHLHVKIRDDKESESETEQVPTYMVSIQHNHSKCSAFQDEKIIEANMASELDWLSKNDSIDSALVVLDQHFRRIIHGIDGVVGRDMRLVTAGDQILVSYELEGNWTEEDRKDAGYWGQTLWAVKGIKVDNETVCTANFTLPGTYSHSWSTWQGDKDVGAIAYKNTTLLLLKDVKDDDIWGPMMMEKRARPSTPTTTTETTTPLYKGNLHKEEHDSWGIGREVGENDYHRNNDHNSINPLWLGDVLPDEQKYLGVTYSYDEDDEGNRANFKHRFFVLRADNWTVEKFSEYFCIPSVNEVHREKNECETIQRIRGVIFDPADTSKLLVSYGIQDCEAVIVRIPVADVLKSLTKTYDHLDLPLEKRAFFKIDSGENSR